MNEIRARKPEVPSDDADEQRCPECDAAGQWEVSRRHRFSPFGSVLLTVLGFWIGVFGWLYGFGYIPAITLFAAAAVTGSATRKAEICGNCGLVRPHGH